MGERLVINFQRDNSTILNTYQHWNGFTRSAMETLINCLRDIEKDNASNDVAKLASTIVNSFNLHEGGILESYRQALNPNDYYGAGLCYEDFNNPEIKKKFDIPITGSRNIGILNVTKETIEDTNRWGEEFATVNLNDLTVNIKDLFWEVTEETLNDRKEFDEDERVIVDFPDFVKSIKKDFYDKSQIEIILTELSTVLKSGYPDFRDSEGNLYSVIE